MTTPDIVVALGPGQGTVSLTADGTLEHHSEFPEDSNVYLRHIEWLSTKFDEVGADLAVLTGSYTRAQTPMLSEAESFLNGWRSRNWAPSVPLALDDVATDSAENVLIGLMVARLVLDGVLPSVTASSTREELAAAHASSASNLVPRTRGRSISRVVVLPAWRFKTLRFSLTLDALGVADYSINGMAEACEARNPWSASHGEAATIRSIVQTNDPLLLGPAFEQKRRERLVKPNFETRLETLRRHFPRTFDAISDLQGALGDRDALHALRVAFREEVLR
jgi:hypothetical protein